MRSSYSAAILLLSAAAIGCGGSVIEQSDSASGVGGAGGAGGSVNVGGAGGSGGSSDGGAAGGSGACGNNLPVCADNEWCKFDIPGSCGKGDESGTCSPKPEGCTETCPGVCGCDGVFYCHECAARSAGVDASGSTACFPAAEYKAENIYTGVPRFAVFKTDPVRSICLRFIVEASGNQGSGFMPPDNWDFNTVQITNNLGDCQPGPAGWLEPPAGEVAEPIGGAGAMTLTYPQGAPNPCLVSVHGYLEFAPGAPWLPVMEQLDADDVMVVGGCS